MNQTNLCENLYSLRKKRGLSQEEFAEQIHVSRQAISKWERGEAYPDIENLIAIAKFYEVTIDDLIRAESVDCKSDTDSKPFNVSISFGSDDTESGNHDGNDEDENEGESDDNGIKVRGNFELCFDEIPYSIVVTVAYLILGFLTPRGWQIWWTLFITIPVYSSLIECFRKKRFSEFSYPVFVAFLYLLIGMKDGIWHPTWIMFITVPIYYCIAAAVDKVIQKKREKK